MPSTISSSPKQTIAVMEFVCGGGLLKGLVASSTSSATSPTPSIESTSDVAIRSLYDEGFAMLSSLMIDLSQLGFEVITALDSDSQLHWNQFRSSVDSVDSTERVRVQWVVDFEHWLDAWLHVARQADRTIVIAPETDNLLCEIVSRLRSNGINVWVSDLGFLEMASNKKLHCERLNTVVQQPSTFLLTGWESSELAASPLTQHFPVDGWVLKRMDGAGCMDMYWFSETKHLWNHVARQHLTLDSFIVQPWHRGEHASCVVLADGSGEMQFVGALKQRIGIDATSGAVRYEGGEGPILEESVEFLQSWVRRILDTLPGARGWIGIDFMYPEGTACIESADQLLLIEINPRLTTSYLGYRQLYGPKIAAGALGLSSDLCCEPRHSGLAGREKVSFGLD